MSFKSKDPTMTLTIRNKAISQVNRRFNTIKRLIRQSIVDNKVLSTNARSQPATKARFVYLRDSEKLEEFMKWLHEQIRIEIFETSMYSAVDIEHMWLNVFIGVAYERGAEKTRQAVGRSAVAKGLIPTSSVFANPAHVERAKLIYTRVYQQLKGVTDTMEQQISRILSDGIIQGKDITTIATELNDRVDKIGKVRSRLIARTEIVNAHNVATIKEAENLENIIGETIKMKWRTCIDGRERFSHELRNNKIYDKKKALSLLGEPNCRCSLSPHLKEFDKKV